MRNFGSWGIQREVQRKSILTELPVLGPNRVEAAQPEWQVVL